VKITTDTDLCIGAGQCALTAGELFDQDAEGIVVLLNPRPPAEHAGAARRAAAYCPSGAISLTYTESRTARMHAEQGER
jgi:ferredoxin